MALLPLLRAIVVRRPVVRAMAAGRGVKRARSAVCPVMATAGTARVRSYWLFKSEPNSRVEHGIVGDGAVFGLDLG